ncbi:TetR/AcrR family transcriptional regulator [Rummeliibacillus sp. TYF005]|uniref:TetR/AcrR family transcriptional regulator n=1 Tax=unclassified Rummeliibacillus TaxID=2622809 RepID=UPI000E6763E1|nr:MULTISPECIES: TetR/AcrR family transcriptional regulator [unclassified Rummeliibacillus]RIJ65023.1 TetR/AcrR family transcriptional regulator [Rummeliibacillus sp. POC4]RPJ94956.1 TetR/AcrR family transcriptional regulator [Rummeliibacillus sp. TYF005]
MTQADIRRHEREQQLIKIALELFATVGYENTKISDIVAKANVSQGTFYWYFKSKEAIAEKVIEDGRKRILKAIAIGYRNSKASVQESAVSTSYLFEQIFQFAEENPYLIHILLKGVHTQPLLQQKVDEIKSEMEIAFANNIERAKQLDMLNHSVDSKLQAVFIMSLLEGVLSRWLFSERSENHPFTDYSLKEIIEKTVHFEFFGIFGV